MPDPKKLEINSPERGDDFFIPPAFRLHVSIHAIGNMGVFWPDVDMAEEVFPHKIGITLIVLLGKTAVFIQVDSAARGKIHMRCILELDKAPVRSQRT